MQLSLKPNPYPLRQVQQECLAAQGTGHWCQLKVKASLEAAFRLSRSQSETGNAVLEAPPPLLAAEPPGAAFPASGWKRGLKRVCA